MCQNQDKIVFCTCSTGDKWDIVNVPMWQLSRFKGLQESTVVGKIMPQKDDLGMEGMNLNSILTLLNNENENPFDFVYKPKDSDLLTIRLTTKEKGKGVKETNYVGYFSLIFEDGTWKQGAHPAFSSISEELSWGKVRTLNPKGYEALKSKFIVDDELPCTFEHIEAGNMKDELKKSQARRKQERLKASKKAKGFAGTMEKLTNWIKKRKR